MTGSGEGKIAARGDYVPVRLQDLRTIAGFACEHVQHGDWSCDEADEMRGGCCNSCWAARWARQVLDERGKGPSETSEEPQDRQK